jgi:hypothetical protein
MTDRLIHDIGDVTSLRRGRTVFIILFIDMSDTVSVRSPPNLMWTTLFEAERHVSVLADDQQTWPTFFCTRAQKSGVIRLRRCCALMQSGSEIGAAARN